MSPGLQLTSSRFTGHFNHQIRKLSQLIKCVSSPPEVDDKAWPLIHRQQYTQCYYIHISDSIYILFHSYTFGSRQALIKCTKMIISMEKNRQSSSDCGKNISCHKYDDFTKIRTISQSFPPMDVLYCSSLLKGNLIHDSLWTLKCVADNEFMTMNLYINTALTKSVNSICTHQILYIRQ